MTLVHCWGDKKSRRLTTYYQLLTQLPPGEWRDTTLYLLMSEGPDSERFTVYQEYGTEKVTWVVHDRALQTSMISPDIRVVEVAIGLCKAQGRFRFGENTC